MGGLITTCARAVEVARAYPRSLYQGCRNRGLFDEVETYCTFIGCSRSGKSLVAAFLDAHPAMIFADELGALKYVHAGFNRGQIYHLLLENSRKCEKAGRRSARYAYQVPGQWQGKSDHLRVIGDNKGEGAVLRLHARPWLLRRLRHLCGVRTAFIHVVRNPYDNISALLGRRDLDMDLDGSIEHYFSVCRATVDVRNRLAEDSEVRELRYESLVKNPRKTLRGLCHFLGEDASDRYLDDCVSILFRSPCQNRHEVEWSPEQIDAVQARIEQFGFLQGYSFAG